MRLRQAGPDILQMLLPAGGTRPDGQRLDLLVDWPLGVSGRLCARISTVPLPLHYDAEIALRTPREVRDARLAEVVRNDFRDRSPRFASLRQELAQAEQQRREFQTLSPAAIQKLIREP